MTIRGTGSDASQHEVITTALNPRLIAAVLQAFLEDTEAIRSDNPDEPLPCDFDPYPTKADIESQIAALRAAALDAAPSTELAKQLFDAFDEMVTTLKAAPCEGASEHTLMMPRESVSRAIYAFRDSLKASLLRADAAPKAPPSLSELLTEADKWVEDSGHWTKSDPYRCASHLILDLSKALRAAALDAAPSTEKVDPQITARVEQIHQKLLHAEALTVGDVVFLFDLVRALIKIDRRQADAAPKAPPSLSELLTEADKWVEDSGHWTKSDPYRCASHLILDLATTLRKSRASLIDGLMKHYPIELRCDHEAKTDECICSCGTYTAPKMPSIGEAIRTWAEHVATALDPSDGPTTKTSHESRSPDGDGQEKSHIGSTARGEPKGVGRISAAADSSHEPTTRDGNRAELTCQFGTNDDACDDRIAKDVAGSEPADSLTRSDALRGLAAELRAAVATLPRFASTGFEDQNGAYVPRQDVLDLMKRLDALAAPQET